MCKIFSRRHALLVGIAFLLAATGHANGDDSDHDLARRLLQEGRILPLAEIVASVRGKVPGEIIEVEFDDDDGAYIYELKILRPDGRVQEVEVEAASGKITKIEDDD